MKPLIRPGLLGIALLAAAEAAEEGTPAEDSLVVITRPVIEPPKPGIPAVVRTRMHDQVAALMRSEVGVFTPPVELKEPEPVVPPADDTLQLEPMTVLGKKIVIPPPVHETPAQEFFRTGVIWSTKDGRMKLWMKGDKGIMFTFAW